MITLKDAYFKANGLLKRWGEKGVDMAGETEKVWLFKGHVINGDDLSGSCIIVEKNNGEMRIFNAGRYEDRRAIYDAKQIDITDMKNRLLMR